MNELYTLLVQPFIEFGFMRRGLVGCRGGIVVHVGTLGH